TLNQTDLTLEGPAPRVYTVTALTEEIRELLEGAFRFIWLEGEISNFRSPASGHYYMGLKDERSQIRAVMFRPQVRYLKFRPEDGMKVLAQGRIGVYEPRGEYQLVLDYLEPLGVGALALAFEQLKRKLAAEGLFNEEIKRPLPFMPGRVAVVTSPTGAAVRDFLKVIHRRFANIDITVVPVRVQGEHAAAEIIAALETVNQELDADVIVLTRGGGSLEDLWAFNDEGLARAIRASGIPVVSAVGHEVDVTIADLAADLRAPTPSAAAEMLVVEKEALVKRLHDLGGRLVSGVRGGVLHRTRHLEQLAARLRDPRKSVERAWLRLDETSGRLGRAVQLIIREQRGRLASTGRSLLLASPGEAAKSRRRELEYMKKSLQGAMDRVVSANNGRLSLAEANLKALDPLAILRRGYSVTRTLPEKKVVRRSSEVEPQDRVLVTLADGELECTVEKTNA
ncbi:MAG: exodeoxyribonuclease VII large subunit, partial [Desulfobacteraceae bacterium]